MKAMRQCIHTKNLRNEGNYVALGHQYNHQVYD
ncbi:uncharacterized protein METZ01_LOCUS45144 [marine metagenome]|uniref:Uncharacterized protein n=1 Tax=marine metagenome TaxID=408172 RepID=A0A381RKC1_9ZZZZ